MIFKKNDFILFIGDSITDCGRSRPAGQGELFDALGNGYVRCLNSITQAYTPELNLRMVNMGIGGNGIRDLENRWETDVLNFKPDWVSILIGINDAYSKFHSPFIPDWHLDLESYTEKLDKLVNETKKTVKGIILMTPFLMDPNRDDAARKLVEEYAAAVKKIAQKHNTYFVDLQSVFDEYFKHRHCSFLGLDKIHPNMIGSMLIAKAFLKEAGLDLKITY